MIAEKISRVRCVLARNQHYLLVQHNNRLPENFGKWGLPGGVLDIAEEPIIGLRRELTEEFQISIGDVVLWTGPGVPDFYRNAFLVGIKLVVHPTGGVDDGGG